MGSGSLLWGSKANLIPFSALLSVHRRKQLMHEQDVTWFRLNVAIIASSAVLAPLQMILSGALAGFD